MTDNPEGPGQQDPQPQEAEKPTAYDPVTGEQVDVNPEENQPAVAGEQDPGVVKDDPTHE